MDYFGDRHQAFTKSHNIILTEILPQMNDMDSGYTAFNIERIPEKHRWLYLDLIALFPCGSLRIAHKDGNRYWHPEFDDPEYLFQYARNASPEYPKQSSNKFYVGGQLNKILRHYIGREGRRETGKKAIPCNEGGWVLLEDLLQLDFIWNDRRDYRWESMNDRRRFLLTRQARIGLIVELTVAENRLKGKTRFQIIRSQIHSLEQRPSTRHMVDGSCQLPSEHPADTQKMLNFPWSPREFSRSST